LIARTIAASGESLSGVKSAVSKLLSMLSSIGDAGSS
jgi:hypothetical protein